MDPAAYQEMAQTEARHWWFCGRRAIARSFIERLKLPPSARILEIGSGTGGNLEMLAEFGEVFAMELDDTARQIALEKTGGRFPILSGRCPDNIPFAEQQFDLICLFDVLEHIDEDTETLAAACARLAPGGRILVTVPACAWLWSRHDVFLHHKRRYSANELRAKILAAGLQALSLSYFNSLLLPLAILARLKDRFSQGPVSGTALPPAPLNALLYGIFAAERHLLSWLRLPLGVSLIATLKKPE